MRGTDNSITSVAALVLIGAAMQRGLEPGPLFAAVGLDPAASPEPDRHILAARYIELWDRVVRRIDERAFAARTGMAFELESLEGFGSLAMSCASLAQPYEQTSVIWRARASRSAR